MYSYEDLIRAVELYINLDKRVRPTIRQLGYPTKNSLKSWYNEYQQKLDLPPGYAGREPKFSQEQKATAIEHDLTHDRCIAATYMRRPGVLVVDSWAKDPTNTVMSGIDRDS
jgi:putative transposase